MSGFYPTGSEPTGYVAFDSGTGIFPSISVAGAAYDTITYDAILLGAPTYPEAGPSENVGFLFPYEIESATLAASSEALPVENLADKHPTVVFRSDGETTTEIDVDLAGPSPANCAVFVATKGSGSDYVRIRGYVTSADRAAETNEVVETNWRSPWPLDNKPFVPEADYLVGVVRWTNDVSLKYWRIDYGDGGNVTFNEIGVLRFGRLWQPSINMDFQGARSREPADLQLESDYGGLYTEERGRPKTVDLTWTAMDYDDARNFAQEMDRRLGRARDLVCIENPGATTDMQAGILYGLLKAAGRHEPKPIWNGSRWMWGVTISLKQLLW